jgi:hypothetical protein
MNSIQYLPSASITNHNVDVISLCGARNELPAGNIRNLAHPIRYSGAAENGENFLTQIISHLRPL